MSKSLFISNGMSPNPGVKELKRMFNCVKAFRDICNVIESAKEDKTEKYDDIENIVYKFGEENK